MGMPSKTIKIRKSTVFIVVLLILFNAFILRVASSYEQYAKQQEAAADFDADYSDMHLLQLGSPAENAPRAVISTSAGDMTMVLYPEEAPEAVRRFTEGAESGALNGKQAALYMSGGIFSLSSPDNGEYTVELSKNLWPFRGAVCMTPSGDIVFADTIEMSEEDKALLRSDESELKDVSRAFADMGGIPDFARVYAVFGQVIEGADVLSAIASSPADSRITVNSVTMIK